MNEVVEVGDVVYKILAEDLTQAGTKLAERHFTDMALAIGTSLVGVGAVISGFTGRYKTFMGEINATAENTSIAAENLQDLALSLSTVYEGVTETERAMDGLGRAGVRTEEQMRLDTQAAISLGQAIRLPASAVVEELVPALGAYGLTADDIAAKSDTVVTVLKNTQMTLGDYTMALEKLAPKAKGLGLSFEDVSAIVEVMSQHGVQGRMIYTDFDEALRSNSRDTEALREKYDSLTETQDDLAESIKYDVAQLDILSMEHPKTAKAQAEHALTVERLTDRLRDEAEEYTNNKAKLDELSASIAKGDFDLQGFYKSLGLTAEEVSKARAGIEANTGATEKYSKITSDAQGSTATLSHLWDEASIKLGELLSPLATYSTVLVALGAVIDIVQGAEALYNVVKASATLATTTETAALAAESSALWNVASAAEAASAAETTLAGAKTAGGMGAATMLGAGATGAGLGLAGAWILNETGVTGGLESLGAGAANNDLMTRGLLSNPLVVGLAALGTGVNALVAGEDIGAKEGALLSGVWEKGGYAEGVASLEGLFGGKPGDIPRGAATINTGTTSYDQSVTIQNVNLGKDYTAEDMMTDFENYQRNKRLQRGLGA